MGKCKKLIACELTPDEFEVIQQIRDTEYGTVEACIKNRNIIQIEHRATIRPPSLEGIR